MQPGMIPLPIENPEVFARRRRDFLFSTSSRVADHGNSTNMSGSRVSAIRGESALRDFEIVKLDGEKLAELIDSAGNNGLIRASAAVDRDGLNESFMLQSLIPEVNISLIGCGLY